MIVLLPSSYQNYLKQNNVNILFFIRQSINLKVIKWLPSCDSFTGAKIDNHFAFTFWYPVIRITPFKEPLSKKKFQLMQQQLYKKSVKKLFGVPSFEVFGIQNNLKKRRKTVVQLQINKNIRNLYASRCNIKSQNEL
jgi:hypothetical protein